MALKAKSKILKLIWNETGSQCSWWSTGVIWQNLPWITTSLAAAFWTLWNLSIRPRFFLIYAGELTRVARMQSKAIATCDKRKNDAVSKAEEVKEVRQYLFTRLPMCYPHCFVFSSHKNAFSVCKKLKVHTLLKENPCTKDSTRNRQSFTRSSVFLEMFLRVLRNMRDFLGRKVACWYTALHNFAQVAPIFNETEANCKIAHIRILLVENYDTDMSSNLMDAILNFHTWI